MLADQKKVVSGLGDTVSNVSNKVDQQGQEIENVRVGFNEKIAKNKEIIDDLKGRVEKLEKMDSGNHDEWYKLMSEIGYGKEDLKKNINVYKNIVAMDRMVASLSTAIDVGVNKYSAKLTRAGWEAANHLADLMKIGKEWGAYSILFMLPPVVKFGSTVVTMDGKVIKWVEGEMIVTLPKSQSEGVTIDWVCFTIIDKKTTYKYLDGDQVKECPVNLRELLYGPWVYILTGSAYGEVHLRQEMVKEMRKVMSEKIVSYTNDELTGIMGPLAAVGIKNLEYSILRSVKTILEFDQIQFPWNSTTVLATEVNLEYWDLAMINYLDGVAMIKGRMRIVPVLKEWRWNQDYSEVSFTGSPYTGSLKMIKDGKVERKTFRSYGVVTEITSVTGVRPSLTITDASKQRFIFRIASKNAWIRIVYKVNYVIEIDDWEPVATSENVLQLLVDGKPASFKISTNDGKTVLFSEGNVFERSMPLITPDQRTMSSYLYESPREMIAEKVGQDLVVKVNEVESYHSNMGLRWSSYHTNLIGYSLFMQHKGSTYQGGGRFERLIKSWGSWKYLWACREPGGQIYSKDFRMDSTIGDKHSKDNMVELKTDGITFSAAIWFDYIPEVGQLDWSDMSMGHAPPIKNVIIPLYSVDLPGDLTAVQNGLYDMVSLKQDVFRLMGLVYNLKELVENLEKRVEFIEEWQKTFLASMKQSPLSTLGGLISVVAGAVGLFMPLVGIAGQILGAGLEGISNISKGDYVDGALDLSIVAILSGYGSRKFFKNRFERYKAPINKISSEIAKHLGTTVRKQYGYSRLRGVVLSKSPDVLSVNWYDNRLRITMVRHSDAGDWVAESLWDRGDVYAVGVKVDKGKIVGIHKYLSKTPKAKWVTTFASKYYSIDNEKRRSLVAPDLLALFTLTEPYQAKEKVDVGVDDSTLGWIDYLSKEGKIVEDLDLNLSGLA
uniref:Uncharacterized protein n=1 Tax=Skokie reo-like virus TaxID=2789444 RepID=A0A7S8WJS1_9REOV|nr:hypothetical protein 2 [Skokie reo-like virus]